MIKEGDKLEDMRERETREHREAMNVLQKRDENNKKRKH